MNSLIQDKNTVNLDFSLFKKKRIKVGKSDTDVIELDTSDMGIIIRLNEIEDKINSAIAKAKALTPESSIEEFAESIHTADVEIRKAIDYLFDANVSNIVAPTGTMIDIHNGTYRFEYIIATLIQLYDETITSELNRQEKKAESHIQKYTEQTEQ